jgi:hypothetical protein
MAYNLSFRIASGYSENAKLALSINGELSEYDLNDQGIFISQEILLKPGKNTIGFITDAKRVDAPNDPRELYLRIWGLSLVNDFVLLS